MNRFLFLLACTLFPVLALSQEEDVEPFSPNEFFIGIGAAFPMEKDPLNVPGEPKVPASFALNIGYRRYLEQDVAIGFRVYGYLNKLSGYTVTDQSNVTSTIDFNIETINIASEGLMIFSNGEVRPYGFIMIGYASGTLSHDKYGELTLNGFVVGGGLGVQFAVSQTVAIALEGVGSFGGGAWKEKPFTNSAGDKFNPSTVMTTANVLIRFP